jgi:hypothetical protein
MILLVLTLWLIPAGILYLLLRRPVQRLIAASKARMAKH